MFVSGMPSRRRAGLRRGELGDRDLARRRVPAGPLSRPVAGRGVGPVRSRRWSAGPASPAEQVQAQVDVEAEPGVEARAELQAGLHAQAEPVPADLGAGIRAHPGRSRGRPRLGPAWVAVAAGVVAAGLVPVRPSAAGVEGLVPAGFRADLVTRPAPCVQSGQARHGSLLRQKPRRIVIPT